MTCSICLNLHAGPVKLRCGHNICPDCMEKTRYNQQNEESTCHECRKPSEDTKVSCTYCMHTSVPAVKSCPTCEASFCDKHLNGHNKTAEHVLIEPTTSFCNRKCSVHKEVLNYYCSEDGAFVCASCWHIGEHRGHQVEPLNKASEMKKEKLTSVLKKRNSRKRRTQERIETLQKEMSSVKDKANCITNRVTALFMDIREQQETLERRILKEVSRQKEQILLSISERIHELEIKKDKLSRQISYTEELCKMTDPVAVLQGQKFDNSNTCLALEVNGRRMSGETVHGIHNLDEVLISMTLHKNLAKIVENVRQMKEFHVPEASDTVLDVNTAGDYVVVSGDMKTASKSKINLCRPETPERFYCVQVLSSRIFTTGRHTWEVEASDCGDWMVGVAYSSIERKGPLSFIGINNKSWCIQKSNNDYSVKHCSTVNPIYLKSYCQKFLIFLDYEAGQLSFYQLSDPICHLYTYTATFAEPLHAAFMVEDDAWVRIRS
ncbi:nuclear factor 7, brain-like [Mixophyes fleayi]|uniref:nuclear factor 7, brain-like n=1 Tax=Mixophyes fleayi TaxID=3061075 RepID=UPI003F4D7EF8